MELSHEAKELISHVENTVWLYDKWQDLKTEGAPPEDFRSLASAASSDYYVNYRYSFAEKYQSEAAKWLQNN